MSDIADRVRKIVVEHLNVDPEKVTDKASFIDDLGADSLDQVELVMAFEEEFSVEIPDDAAESIQTFGDAVAFSMRVKNSVLAVFISSAISTELKLSRDSFRRSLRSSMSCCSASETSADACFWIFSKAMIATS